MGPIAGLHELEGLLFGLEEVNVVALRAAWHMENLLANLPMIRSQGINGGAIKGNEKFPMIATVDIAEKAAQHLIRREFTGHTIETALGPEDVSMNEATRVLGTALGLPDLPYVEFPPEGVKAALLDAGMPEEVAWLLVEGQLAINEGLVMDGVQAHRRDDHTHPARRFLMSALPDEFIHIT